jgi:hypothetical protein
MSPSRQIKRLLVETVYKKAARSAAQEIVKSPEPEFRELDIIAYKHIIGMLIPRSYELIKKDWEWATGGSIPISMKDALEYYERHVKEPD